VPRVPQTVEEEGLAAPEVPRRQRSRRVQARPRAPRKPPWWAVSRHAVEGAALLAALLIGVLAVLGRVADRFTGTGLWSHLFPFAGAVLVVGLVAALALYGWLRARTWLEPRLPGMSLVLALLAATAAVWFATGAAFQRDATNLQTLVGGKEEAERRTISHQVFAAYRRSDLKDVWRVLERGRVYEPTIHEAAAAFGVDPEVLMGVAAAESSFLPRDSKDGGRGLFQLTAPPKRALTDVHKRLAVDELDGLNQRHNAFVAAATLRRYMDEMRGDPFLGLLAYNIGPKNGGLRMIMERYGARDFVTIQPYLQNLPRDYPIRVLSYALAYRLWKREGKLPRYEEGDNAAEVQRVGIPGLMGD